MQELDEYIDKVKSLPPAPRILPELLSVLRDDDVDSSRVVELISFDPGITASVLRLCNSAFYAGAMPADDLLDAVNRLGFRQVYQLVAAVSGGRMMSTSQKEHGINSGELWEHCVTASITAQLIAARNGDDEGVVFTATLLHDVGKMILAEALQHIYAKLLEDSKDQQSVLVETEKRLLGVQHAEIGGRLLARWNFPPNLVDAVWHHHSPGEAKEDQKLAAYVYLGNLIAHFMGTGYGPQAISLRGRSESLEILNLKLDALPEIMTQASEKLQVVDTLVKAAA
jgi:putative nucleotidyltransferase with HDIG domain